MVEKGKKGGTCHFIYRYAKANNKYTKDYHKKKNRHIFNIGMEIIYMVGQCHQSFQQITLSGSYILFHLIKT